MTFIEKLFHGDPAMLRGMGVALGDFSVNFFLAGVILVGAIWASGWAAKLVERGIGRLNRRHGPDPTLQSFASSVTRYVVIIVGLIAVLQQVGVRTTSIIAVLGAASLAVGLALQGALGNVAAGVMLLLFRPYRVGDDIEIGGKRGHVRSLDLFVTELATDDNVRIMAPNGKVFGDFIMNHTHYRTRRAVVTFRIGLEDDPARALKVLQAAASADSRVLRDPAPVARAQQIGDSYVEVALKAWSSVEDHAAVKSQLIVGGLAALREHGFAQAYPKQVAIEGAREEAPALN